MGTKKKYSTKQMELLNEYLITTKGSHFTVKNIEEYFYNSNQQIGTTTIYRYLENLVKDNIVIKFNNTGKTGAVFEYIGTDTNNLKSNCLHIICESCGDISHFNCEEINKINSNIEKELGFKINTSNPTFFGNCGECLNK